MKLTLILFATLALSCSAKPCGTLPPGFNLLAKGYDLSTINLLDSDGMNWKNYVLDVSCNQSLTYVNDYNNKMYQVPDQLDGTPLNVGGSAKETTNILTNNSQAFKESLAVEIEESAFWGLFSSSQSFTQSAILNAQEYVYAGVITSHVASYQLELHESFRTDLMRLGSDAQFLVDQLENKTPEFNSSTFAAFEQFISDFGTDYLKKATVGCKFQYQHFTGVGKLDVMAKGDVGLNAGLDFLGFLAASGAVGAQGSAASQSYLNITKSSPKCFGGTFCPQNGSSAEYDEWQKSCATIPAFIKGEFAPVADLIKNPTVQKSMRAAVVNHFNRAFLKDELIPLMNAFVDVVAKKTIDNGTCAIPHICPEYAVGSRCFVSSGFCDTKRCGNVLTGQTDAQLNATHACIKNNQTKWLAKMKSTIQQAQAALKPNIVTNATVALLSGEFLVYVYRVAAPFIEEGCGWTFNGLWDTNFNACANWGGTCGVPPNLHKNFPLMLRKLTYLKSLC
jgi:hypothetical protein